MPTHMTKICDKLVRRYCVMQHMGVTDNERMTYLKAYCLRGNMLSGGGLA